MFSHGSLLARLQPAVDNFHWIHCLYSWYLLHVTRSTPQETALSKVSGFFLFVKEGIWVIMQAGIVLKHIESAAHISLIIGVSYVVII